MSALVRESESGADALPEPPPRVAPPASPPVPARPERPLSPSEANASTAELAVLDEDVPRRRGASPLWLAVPLILFAALGVAVYLPSRRVSPITQVRVTPVRLETVVRLYSGTTQLHAVEPVRFAFPDGGTIAELLPPGQQVKAGDTLAKLEGYIKLEKQLGEIRSREAFYQGELQKAERAGNRAGIAHATAKIEEKRGIIAALQAKYGRLVLSSTTPGIVSENLVKVGDVVQPAQPVTSVVQLRLRADFTLPAAEGGSLKTGMIGRLQRDDGKLVDCRIEKVDSEGDQTLVRVEVMDIASGVQARDNVRLVRSRLEGVVRLPALAVMRATGGIDQVFVVQDGKARQRVITILDRDSGEVLVGQGITVGDRVVTNGTIALHDGAPVHEE
jgi:RND family efflux transporter MFP subunit